MKISRLISMLEAVQKSRGDLEIPFQICYEKLFENGELNKDFIKRFSSDDLFEYYCSELGIPNPATERAKIAYNMACRFEYNRISQLLTFLEFLNLAGIYYKTPFKNFKDFADRADPNHITTRYEEGESDEG